MSVKMAIVLPGKKRKKTDIFAPSQAIQNAKEKIGPAYFDISLLECSRNAVELTKLISRWDELEKEKIKIIRDINREEDVLIRSLKAQKSNDKDGKNENRIASTEGIETIDGKVVPPGFRFTSNGNIKSSTLLVPLVKTDEILKDFVNDRKNDATGKVSNTKNQVRKFNSSTDSNYEQEILELESVIKNIYKDLSQFGESSKKVKSKEKFHAYLRAHKNDYVSTENIFKAPEYQSPNDRFAFKPGSASKLYKNEIKTPTYRSCIGCKFKLKCDDEVTAKLIKLQSEDLGKRRWSYVPRGKYVQSTCSLLSKPSAIHAGDRTTSSTKHIAKSVVHFETSRMDLPQRAKSVQAHKSPGSRTDQPLKSALSARSTTNNPSQQRSSHSAFSKRSLATPSDYGRSISSVSGFSQRLSSSRISAHLLVDHESRMQTLKKFQEEEQHICDEKVKTFLRKLGPESPKKRGGR